MHLSSIFKTTEQLDYQKRSESEILFSKQLENTKLNFLRVEETRRETLIHDQSNSNIKTQLYSNKNNKPSPKPVLKITVSFRNPVRRLSRAFTKKEYYKKVEATISNHENSLRNIHLRSIDEQRKQKVYEIKKSESDILHYKNNKKYAVYKYPDLGFLRMENNRKDIKTTRIKRPGKECNCETSDYKLGNDNERKNRVTIVGQLGLTQDERYVLKCAATLNDKPIPTSFSQTMKNSERLLKQNKFNDVITQTTQVDLDLPQRNKKSLKNRLVQCDCPRGKTDAAVSKMNVLKECNSPLVIISVYPRQGETESANYCPVKIVQHQNITKNKIPSKLETERFKDKTILHNKTERLQSSRSPSPANRADNANKNKPKDSTASVLRKHSPENKKYKISYKPNELKRDVFCLNEQNKYSKNFKKQSNKIGSKDPKSNAEQVKKALVSNFLRNIDSTDINQPKIKVINAKDNASKITINIDGDNENYDVMFEKSDFDTGVTVRKTAKRKNRNKEIGDDSSMQNFLMLSDDTTKASYSRQPNYMQNETMLTDSKLNVRDSLEIRHRREKEKVKKNKNNIENNAYLNDNAPLRHYRGDNCSLTDPNERDREIRELLGVLRDNKKSNIEPGTQDKDNCLKTCSESLITGHNIRSLYDININENKDIRENLNKVIQLNKEQNVETISNYCTLTKNCYTNDLFMPQNLMLSRNIQVFVQLDDINKIRPICLKNKQYQKVKRNVQCAISKKNSIEKRSRNIMNMNSVFIGEIKVKPNIGNTLHFDREVQTDLSEIKKITKIAKRKYCQNIKVFNEILSKSNPTKCVNKALICECSKHTKQKNVIYNDCRHVVSSIEIGYTDAGHGKPALSPIMACEKKSFGTCKQHNSIQTLFKGHRRSITPNLGTSALSLDSERTGINNYVKPFGAGDCKSKKPFLRRLISCLVMRSAQTSVLKAEIPGKERVRLSNSVDSYYINTSLGAFEMSSSLYDTSISFYSNHTTMPVNKIKRGLFTSVREFLTGRRT